MNVEVMDDAIAHIRRSRERIMNLETLMKEDVAVMAQQQVLAWFTIQVTKEFHLPQNVEVELLIRSQDVIHSAYLPHLRAQMNAVPGMTTRMHLVPTITTDSMRQITDNPNFDYILLCNKVCGISHYNMQSALVVEKPGAFKVWTILLAPFEKTGSSTPAAVDSLATPVAVEAKAAQGALADSTMNELKTN